MVDIRELTIKIAVDGSGAAMKLKSVTAALNKTQEAIKGTGKASTAAGKSFQKASKSMQTAAQRTEKKMRKLRASLGNIKESLRSLAQTATRTAAVMIGGASAVTAVYARFERAMIRSSAIAAGTASKFGGAFRSMSKEAMKVANTTEHTAKQVGEGMEFMAMAGLKANRIVASTASVADLASAAGIRMADAANIATNIMTAFGKKSEDLARINNVLTGTFTNSNVNIMQLGEAMKVVGANASILGLSIEETSAAIGLLGNVGIQGTEAGTGLKRAISALVKPSKQSAKAMGRLGLNTKVLTKSSRNMKGGLLRVVAILQGTQKAYKAAGKDTEFLADMFEVFGERSGPKMAALVKQGTDAFIELNSAIEDAISNDLTTWLSGIQRESTKGQWDILVSNIESAAISIGKHFAPAAESVMKVLKDLAQAIQGMSGESLNAIARIGAFATALTAGAAAFFTAAGGIWALKYAIAGLAGAGVLGAVALGLGNIAAVVAILSYPKLAAAALGIGLITAALFGLMAAAVGVTAPFSLVAAAIAGVGLAAGALVASFRGMDETWANGAERVMDWGKAADDLTRSWGSFFRTIAGGLASLVGLTGILDDLADAQSRADARDSSDSRIRYGQYLEDLNKRHKKLVPEVVKIEGELAEVTIPPAIKAKLLDMIFNIEIVEGADGVREAIKGSGGVGISAPEEMMRPGMTQEKVDVFAPTVEKILENIKNLPVAITAEQSKTAVGNIAKAIGDLAAVQFAVESTSEANADKVTDAIDRITDNQSGGDSYASSQVRKLLEGYFEAKGEKDIRAVKIWIDTRLPELKRLKEAFEKHTVNMEKDTAKLEAALKLAADKVKEAFVDLAAWMRRRTRDLNAATVSPFSPGTAAGMKGVSFLEKESESLAKRFAKAGGGIADLGRHSNDTSKYLHAVSQTALSLAGSSLAASFGTDSFTKNLGAAERLTKKALQGFSEEVKGFGAAVQTDDVRESLYNYALAHADIAGKLKKVTADRIKAEESYAASMGKLSAIIAGIEKQLELAKSKSPEMTSVFQEGAARKKGIDDTAEEAIKSAQAAKVAAFKEIKLRSLLEKQNIIQEHLVKKMGDLSVYITKLTAAIVNANPDQVTGKAEEAKSDVVAARASVDLSGLQLAAQLEGSERSYALLAEMEEAAITLKKRLGAARSKQNEALEKNTELITLNAKALILQGGTIEELNNAMAEARKQGGNVEELTDAMNDVPFSKLAATVDSMSASLEDSFDRIGDLFIEKKTDPETGEITGASVLGQQLDKKQLQNLVNSKSVITDMLGNMGGETSGWGSMLGMGIGALIGSFAGNTAIGAKVGQAVGNVIEGVLGVVKKGFGKLYAAFDTIAKSVGKLSELVPENRFQSSAKQGGKIFAPIATAITSFLGLVITPLIGGLSYLGFIVAIVIAVIVAAIANYSGQFYMNIALIVAAVGSFVTFLATGAAAVLAAIGTAAGGAIASFLMALGMKELKYDTIAASPLDTFRAEERGETPENMELDEEHRTPWTRIMDALAVSIDRVIFAMGPFYENLFALVGLFDMVMQAFVVIADSLGNLDFGETLYEIFKNLALRVIEVITALAHMHNLLMIGAQANHVVNEAAIGVGLAFVELRRGFGDFLHGLMLGLGNILNELDPLGMAGDHMLTIAGEVRDKIGYSLTAESELLALQEDLNNFVGDLAQFIDPDQFKPLWQQINDSNWQDGMDRFNWLDDIAEPPRKEDKEFGEQLTNVPSGFKVNLARYKAMDAEGEGAAGDGDGGSLWSMGSNEYFRRLEDAIRNGNDFRGFMEGQSLSELGEEIRSMVDNLMDPSAWGEIFGNSIREVGDELGNAVDSLTNTLGLALLGPDEAFQGASGVGPAMGGRQAGGDPTSGGSTMNININELSIADAANPEQLANMIAERSTRGQMAQAGSPFPSLQSGDAWNNGGGRP